MLIDSKLSKKLFAILALYSTNVLVMANFIGENPDFYMVAISQIVYFVVFFGITYMFMGKLESKRFFWYLLFGLYTLTWIPITIQGMLDKNNKEWNHTKHVRQIGIYDV